MLDEFQLCATVRTERNTRSAWRIGLIAWMRDTPGVQSFPGLSNETSIRWAQNPVVSDFDEVVRKNVLKETANEFLSRDSCISGLLGSRILVREGNEAIFKAENTLVTDCDAKDIGCQVLESSMARAN